MSACMSGLQPLIGGKLSQYVTERVSDRSMRVNTRQKLSAKVALKPRKQLIDSGASRLVTISNTAFCRRETLCSEAMAASTTAHQRPFERKWSDCSILSGQHERRLVYLRQP